MQFVAENLKCVDGVWHLKNLHYCVPMLPEPPAAHTPGHLVGKFGCWLVGWLVLLFGRHFVVESVDWRATCCLSMSHLWNNSRWLWCWLRWLCGAATVAVRRIRIRCRRRCSAKSLSAATGTTDNNGDFSYAFPLGCQQNSAI